MEPGEGSSADAAASATHGRRVELLDLPEETLSAIFARMSVDDVGRCASVCRTFNDAASDDELWRHFCRRDLCLHDIDLPASGSKLFYRHSVSFYCVMRRISDPSLFAGQLAMADLV